MKFKYLFLSLLSGILSGVSFNLPYFSFLIWVSLVFLFIVIKKSSYKVSFLYSYLAGFIHFLTIVFWIGFVTRLGLFFLLLYLSLYWAVSGLTIKGFLDKRLNFLLIPFFWVIFEYIRTNLGGFGWALFGYSQFKNLILIQVASILGVWPISFLIISFNTILFNLLDAKRIKKVSSQLFIFFLLLFSFLVYGYFSLKNPLAKERIFLVTIIQPNIPQQKKWDSLYYQEIEDKLSSLLRRVPPQNLAIFPEASWPCLVNEGNLKELEYLAKSSYRDILIGVVEKIQGKYFNSSFLISKGGRVLAKYRKLKLVPFGEFVPLRRVLGFIPVVSSFGDISPGKKYSVFTYKNTKIATLICFEDTFPKLVSDFVKKGANVLVNITNDAWFRGYPQVVQHLQIAVFRAVEQRKYLIRSSNTGISCIISPKGEIIKSLRLRNKKIFVEGLLNGKIFPQEGVTLYSKLGDIFIYIGLGFCVIGFFNSRLRS